MICRDDFVESDLLNILHHDYHTFTHSANVSYYCVILAKALQITDERELNRIAAGAMLHDLGKLEIPDKILNKPSRLSSDERDIICRHPETGFRKSCQRGDLSFGQLMMVYQHHERLDGKGYPTGIRANEIHEWTRVCSVADVFEALTSNRPYRSAVSPAQAIEMMDRDTALAFDDEMLNAGNRLFKQDRTATVDDAIAPGHGASGYHPLPIELQLAKWRFLCASDPRACPQRTMPHPRSTDPTPDEICQQCEAIQASLSPSIERLHSPAAPERIPSATATPA